MQIQELTLQTRHVASQKTFYGHTLGWPLLSESPDSFTVKVGTTRLCFQQTEQDVLYHLAVTIPRNTFPEAKCWVQQRVPLLQRQGEDELFFANLNARSFYFCDPAGNILEYIVHYELDRETPGAFGATSVLHVSEIGLPVEDVSAFAELVSRQFAIEPYRGMISETFAFLGDRVGQLVVVKIDRPWLPTETVRAAVAPVSLTISGQHEQQIRISPYPYSITVSAS